MIRRFADHSTAHRRRTCDGFALVEITLALMLIGLLAALALPGLVRTTGSASLRMAAFQVSALLREDRSIALSSGRSSSLLIEANGHRVRSRNSVAFVDLPIGATATIIGAETAAILFFADGRSSGGNIVLASASARYVIDVSPDSGAIHVASP